MTRISRDHERFTTQAQQVVFAHQPQHVFMVHRETSPFQLGGDSTVSIGRRFHRDLLQLIAQFHLHRSGPRRQPPAVIAGPAQTGHLAQRIHGLAFLPRLTDFFKQTSAPLTTASG